ncbi:MAG: hypothetical protein NTW66_00015 [Candidatus Magasanikbacteria bacterium]|nr:hypothetical protein [Candidatus Magasanikbacteria bacterium]
MSEKKVGFARDEIISLLVMLLARVPRPPNDDDVERLLGLLELASKKYVALLCEAIGHALPQARIDKNDPVGAVTQFITMSVRLVKEDQVASYISYILEIDKGSDEYKPLQETVTRQMAGSSPKIKREQALGDAEKQRQELDALVNKIMQGQQTIEQKRTELGDVYHQIEQMKQDVDSAERDAIATEILAQGKLEVATARTHQAEARLQEAEMTEAAAFRQLESAEMRIVAANTAAESGRIRDNRLVKQALSEVGVIFPDNEALAAMADEVNENNAVIVARQLVNQLLRDVITRLTLETRDLASEREDLVAQSKELENLRATKARVMQEIRDIEAVLAELFADLSSRRSSLQQKEDEKLAVVAECEKEAFNLQKAIADAQARMAQARESLRTTLEQEISSAMTSLKQHVPAKG